MDGFSGSGLNPHGWGWQPNWYNLFADNSILEGNALGGKTASFSAGGAIGPFTDAYCGNFSGPLNLGAVFRRNRAHNNAGFVVAGSVGCALLDLNGVERTTTGMVVTNQSFDVFLAGSWFADVKRPVCLAETAPGCIHGCWPQCTQ